MIITPSPSIARLFGSATAEAVIVIVPNCCFALEFDWVTTICRVMWWWFCAVIAPAVIEWELLLPSVYLGSCRFCALFTLYIQTNVQGGRWTDVRLRRLSYLDKVNVIILYLCQTFFSFNMLIFKERESTHIHNGYI